MKTYAFAIIISMMPVLGLAAPGDNLADLYFSSQNPKLTPQEKAAIAIAEKWQAASATGIKPVSGTDGSIRYLFGAQEPSIVCAVLQVCDVELQAGEQVNSIHLVQKSQNVSTDTLEPLNIIAAFTHNLVDNPTPSPSPN